MGLEELDGYRDSALEELALVGSEAALAEWARIHLAASGRLNQWKRSIGKQPKTERRAFGQAIHQVGQALTSAFEGRKTAIETEALAARLGAERVDLSLPARPRRRGGLHPLVRTLRDITRVFGDMGFSVFESRHVETDYFNFQALNMPPHHPARDMQDTFYVDGGEGPKSRVLRTHTSAGQIHAMRTLGPGPIRVILPGLCYRNEDVTTRSEMQFHQVEGLMVGPKVRMSDLKGILLQFARAIFGPDQQVRLRGSYFPFTEPSVEVDIQCTLCAGEGCRVCKYTGWLEILGAGLVHPVVLEHGGYDPVTHRGIAFGMGVERMVMLQHGIDDIRQFFRNDVRFLEHFR